MIPQSYKRHVNTHSLNIKRLKRLGYEDNIVLSLLLLEQYFRSPSQRVIEFIFYLLTKSENITIGKAQMRVKYWHEFEGLKFSNVIKILFSDRYNYKAITFYLIKNHSLTSDIKEISKKYNGNSTTYYNFLIYSFNEIKGIR